MKTIMIIPKNDETILHYQDTLSKNYYNYTETTRDYETYDKGNTFEQELN